MTDRRTRYFDDQTTKFASGRIGRRTFIRSLVAAGLAVPTAMSMAGRVLAATPNAGGHSTGHGSWLNHRQPRPCDLRKWFMTHTGLTYGNNLTEVGRRRATSERCKL